MIKKTLYFLLLFVLALGTQAKKSIIFETDMGNDVDDAWALDMLHKYADEGKIRLLAVMLNKEGVGPCQYVDLMNTWYGRPAIPIGRALRENKSVEGMPNFTSIVADMKGNDGSPLYPHKINSLADCTDAVTLYRQILSKQKDHSVTIVSVGFSGNLAALLHTGPDKYSALSGRELVERKIESMVVMAGHIKNPDYVEYNVMNDIPSCHEVFANWPTEIVVTPFELGKAALLPADCLKKDFSWTNHHPVLDGIMAARGKYENYPTWDMTAVVYAVEGCAGYFTLSLPGTITVTERGCTHYQADAHGHHRYLTTDHNQCPLLVQRMRDLVARKPKNKK